MSAAAALSPSFSSAALPAPSYRRWATLGSILFSDFLAITASATVAVIVRYLLGARYAPSDYLHFTPALAMMNRSSTGWFAPKLLSHREAIIDRQKADPTDVPATWAAVSRA